MDYKKTMGRILIVDDTEENIDILLNTLSDGYDISVSMDGADAIKLLEKNKPDLILLDIMLPGMNGYEVCRVIKNNIETKDIPIIFMTSMTDVEAEEKGLKLGAVDFIIKPFSPIIVSSRVKNHIERSLYRIALEDSNNILEQRVKERTDELNLVKDVTIHSLASLAETRDNETGAHIFRTKHYVKIVAEWLIINGIYSNILGYEDIELMFKSAPLHDIGKVGIADKILLKPGKLTEEEFEEIKKHPVIGRDALLKAEIEFGINTDSSFLRYARQIAYTHHERWDGTGYPLGLIGEEIPISGRIMALADVYDALISKRIYKPAFTNEKVREIIISSSGSHFDPNIVAAFISLEDKFKEIVEKYREE